MKHFDVIVVGGGHAGVEAALASARRGANTALVTFRAGDLGVMSCNPAIGGIGKGHLVREIDALDGVMGLAADYAGIQFRLLNRSRGPAVQGPRVQADRKRYAQFIQRSVAAQQLVSVIEGEVVDVLVTGQRIEGVVLKGGATVTSHAVVLTTGTFLGGQIHVGSDRIPAGRKGANASVALSARLREIATGIGRLKTGTPARLDGRTIDWAAIGTQDGDHHPVMMSFLNTSPVARQVACGVTETNERTHDIIRKNLHKSAMGVGNISGIGPRYCPSVEDKVTRFADKTSHNVFLEPEGLDDHTVYPNGISTSLPIDIQEAFLKSIRGLEEVAILEFGYAIEYDFVDPTSLDHTLALRGHEGLFLAGQINGTTGYEEAAAQGLLAGANAASFASQHSPIVPDRSQSYIGVMIDDLVRHGVSEPYRMFTSRAEYRLSLRADNADQRLFGLGLSAGLMTESRAAIVRRKLARLERTATLLDERKAPVSVFEDLGLDAPRDGKTRTYRSLAALGLAKPDFDFHPLANHFPEIALADLEQVARDSFYEPYISRQRKEVEALSDQHSREIPEGFDFGSMPSLSKEIQTKLCRVLPRSIGQAAAIEGMTPAALVVLIARISASAGTVARTN